MADGKVEIDTGIDTSGAEKGLQTLRQKLDSFAKKLSSGKMANMGASITGITSGFNAATSAIKLAAGALKNLSDSYKIQKNAEVQLQTAVKNSPYLDGTATKALAAYASELQGVTNFGDEQMLPSACGTRPNLSRCAGRKRKA